MNVRDGRKPFRAQEVDELRSVGVGLSLACVGAVVSVRHPVSASEGVQQLRHDRQRARGEAGKRRQIVGTVVVQQDFVVTGDQLVSTFAWFRLGVLGAKDAGYRLVLEPFPYVALVGSGPMGEHFGGRRFLLQGGVKAEAVTDIDGEYVESRECRSEHPLYEAVAVCRRLF